MYLKVLHFSEGHKFVIGTFYKYLANIREVQPTMLKLAYLQTMHTEPRIKKTQTVRERPPSRYCVNRRVPPEPGRGRS
jgi:hypothetical protein